jgi:hypothetical protein
MTSSTGHGSHIDRITPDSDFTFVLKSKPESLFIKAALALAICLGSCSRPASYLGFINQDQSYYHKIAEACAEIESRTPTNVLDGRKISASALTLPPLLKELHPTYLRVTTNRVYVSVGVGRGSYSIAWLRGFSGQPFWELRATGEDIEKLLLTELHY